MPTGATIQISLTPEAQTIMARLRSPSAVLSAVAAALNAENPETVSHIQEAYLSFPKHGKPTLAGLRAVTQKYRQSLNASEPVIIGTQVVTTIGSNAKATGSNFSYPKLHEFGGSWSRTVKPGVVRLRTNAAGELLRQKADSRLAVFAKKTHADSRVRLKPYEGGKAYTVTMPARAPIQKGIRDRLDVYGARASQGIVDGWGSEV